MGTLTRINNTYTKTLLSTALCLTTFLLPATAYADSTNRGLGIMPIRKDSRVDAGTAKADFFTVANYTGQVAKVNVSVQQFTVADYSYNYTFDTPKNNWIKLSEPTSTLNAGESRKIYYDIEVPKNATPGGYYLSLSASTSVPNGSVPSTVQASMLIYLTVKGDLVRTSVLKNDSIPRFTMDAKIPYQFDVKDTGNVHFNAYFYGRLDNIFGEQGDEDGTNHILLPGTTRTITGTIPSPALPGIYKATYGYKVDFADITVTKSSWLVYLPPWSLLTLLLISFIVVWIVQHNPKRKKPSY